MRVTICALSSRETERPTSGLESMRSMFMNAVPVDRLSNLNHFGGHPRQQQVTGGYTAGMDRVRAGEFRHGAVTCVVVHEYSRALHHAGCTGAGKILTADGEREHVALRDDDRGRPDFDVGLVHGAGRQLLLPIMRMERPVGL